jgi:hypothetical protein
MAAGQVSVDQAAVVARFAPSSHEASVGELAPMTTVPQLRRALSRYQFGSGAPAAGGAGGSPDPAGRDERDVPGTVAYAAKAAELSMSYGDGRFLLRYSAPADLGALVEQAVREAKDALFTSGRTDATSADALAEIAARSLASVGSGSRAARYRVYVHLSTDGSWVGGRGAIPPSLAAKFACDGTVQPVWEVDGTPVSVGRKQRIVPDRTRRLVVDRDRGCAFPGCQATGYLEVHHLDHWADGGGPTWTGWSACARSTTTPTTAASSPSPALRSIPTGCFSRRRMPLPLSPGWCSPTGAASSSAHPPSRRQAPRRPTRPTRLSRTSTHTEDPPASDCTPAGWT